MNSRENCGSEEACIPRCPCCGMSVRRCIPNVRWPIVGSFNGGAYDYKAPWNYKWDGICENCGNDFNIYMELNLEKEKIHRQTTIKVSKKSVPTIFIDSLVGFSGIEIEQVTDTDGTIKMFMTTGELKFLLDKLKNSPILEQLDWKEDYT